MLVVSDYERMCAPSIGAILEVEVLLRAGHSEQREVQLRESDQAWEEVWNESAS